MPEQSPSSEAIREVARNPMPFLKAAMALVAAVSAWTLLWNDVQLLKAGQKDQERQLADIKAYLIDGDKSHLVKNP